MTESFPQFGGGDLLVGHCLSFENNLWTIVITRCFPTQARAGQAYKSTELKIFRSSTQIIFTKNILERELSNMNDLFTISPQKSFKVFSRRKSWFAKKVFWQQKKSGKFDQGTSRLFKWYITNFFIVLKDEPYRVHTGVRKPALHPPLNLLFKFEKSKSPGRQSHFHGFIDFSWVFRGQFWLSFQDLLKKICPPGRGGS